MAAVTTEQVINQVGSRWGVGYADEASVPSTPLVHHLQQPVVTSRSSILVCLSWKIKYPMKGHELCSMFIEQENVHTNDAAGSVRTMIRRCRE